MADATPSAHTDHGAAASANDAEFDALLEGAPKERPKSAEAPAPSRPDSAQAETDTHAHSAAPSLREFVEHWELYRDPVVCGTFAGLALAVLGVFVVLRRAVFVTAAVSQAAGLGVALSFLLTIHTGLELPPVVLALVLSLGAALLVAGLRRAPAEAVIGFVYLAASALAVIVGAGIGQEAHDIAAILFGTAVLVRPLDVSLVVGVGTLSVALVLVARRGLVFSGFDPDAARVQGLPVRKLETLLWVLLSLVAAVTTRALGALPVFAFAVLPALGALAVAERMHHALALAAVLGVLSGGLGYLSAFLLDLPVGAAQSCVAALGCLLCVGARRLRG
jgi:zinc transport system permease protein